MWVSLFTFERLLPGLTKYSEVGLTKSLLVVIGFLRRPPQGYCPRIVPQQRAPRFSRRRIPKHLIWEQLWRSRSQAAILWPGGMCREVFLGRCDHLTIHGDTLPGAKLLLMFRQRHSTPAGGQSALENFAPVVRVLR